MKLHFCFLALIVLLVQLTTAKRIDFAHEVDLGNVRISDLVDKILPALDISKPLYELGKLANRGGQAISPGLQKAGYITTSAGIALINVGSLLTATSRALSKDGPIGGNPNFINQAVARMLIRRNAQNQYNPKRLTVKEMAEMYKNPLQQKTSERDIVMQPHTSKPVKHTYSSSKHRNSNSQQDRVIQPLRQKSTNNQQE